MRFPCVGAEMTSSWGAWGPRSETRKTRGGSLQLFAFVARSLLRKRDGYVARRMRRLLNMKRSLLFSVAILVAALFVGTALKVQAATTSAPAAAAAQADGTTDGGYWAAWAEAASH